MMARTRPFKQVDVFTAMPYFGNALAVVLDGKDLSDAQMQRFAMWTNLAETTFLLPPTAEAAAAGADYQVRIFTTAYEMPFAGHPTLGSCHAWLEHGGVPKDPARIVQQCKVGCQIEHTVCAVQQQAEKLGAVHQMLAGHKLPGLQAQSRQQCGQQVRGNRAALQCWRCKGQPRSLALYRHQPDLALLHDARRVFGDAAML